MRFTAFFVLAMLALPIVTSGCGLDSSGLGEVSRSGTSGGPSNGSSGAVDASSPPASSANGNGGSTVAPPAATSPSTDVDAGAPVVDASTPDVKTPPTPPGKGGGPGPDKEGFEG